MRFVIFTHVEHKKKDQLYYGYGPYIREMNIWLSQVSAVEIVAPLTAGSLNPTNRSYEQVLRFTPIPSIKFVTFTSSVRSLLRLPLIIFRIFDAMRRADHLHLRCPGNIGLLGCILQIFFPSKSKTAKYAGNWDPEAKQPWTYNLQKWILSNTFLTKDMQVLVYGKWPQQSKNVKSFFTASFSKKEILQVREKSFQEPIVFLFVGNLVPGKHPLRAVQLVQEIDSSVRRYPQAPGVQMEIYGDGPEREMLEIYCMNEGLNDLVHFKGNRLLEELKEAYVRAHFVILPSESEGWPKAIAEGMFFGCIPIATPVSCVPWMLGDGKRGIICSPVPLRREQGEEWVEKTVREILNLMKNPEEMKQKSKAAKEWSQQYTLERFDNAIQEILV